MLGFSLASTEERRRKKAASELLTQHHEIEPVWKIADPKVPPHPCPLPRGEGESPPAYLEIELSDFPTH